MPERFVASQLVPYLQGLERWAADLAGNDQAAQMTHLRAKVARMDVGRIAGQRYYVQCDRALVRKQTTGGLEGIAFLDITFTGILENIRPYRKRRPDFGGVILSFANCQLRDDNPADVELFAARPVHVAVSEITECDHLLQPGHGQQLYTLPVRGCIIPPACYSS